MSAQGEEVLRQARRSVLRMSRHLLLWVGIPLIFVNFVGALRAGRPVWVMGLELAVLIACSAVLWHDRERHAERGGRVLTFSLFVITSCALVHFGPLMGTGAMWIGWALFAVFFLERVALAILGVAVVCVGMWAWLWLLGPPATWPVLRDGTMGFVRVGSTLLLLTTAVSYLFGRLVHALSLAVDHEHEALERERALRLEQEETERQLADSKRLEAVGELASGAAHDFNNVLTVFAGGLHSLKTASESERSELMAELERALDMARATTRQLLSFAKQGASPSEHADPEESITTLARALTRLLPANLRVEQDVAPTSRVSLSSGGLEQLLLNLALNARDAMPRGGTLTLRCYEDRLLEERGVRIEVDDTGVGITAHALVQAGQPFFSTKPNGAGLGLSMVRRTIAEARGDLTLERRDTGGTRVSVWLPCASEAIRSETSSDVSPSAAASPALERPARPSGAEPKTPAHVLLLEDEPDVRRTLTRVLERDGHRVTATVDVAEALAALQNASSFDLVVSDANLPDGSASPVVRSARKAGLPVIVCSGHVDGEEVLREIEHSEVSFLQKPCEPRQLLALVLELADQHRSTLVRLASERPPAAGSDANPNTK